MMSSDSSSSLQTDGRRQGRLQLLLILGITLFSVLASYVMFYTGIGIPEETKNKGILFSNPINIADLDFKDDNGLDWRPANQARLFRMVTIIDGDCDEVCRDQLYVARQVHARLSERADQVERLLINTSSEISPELRSHLQQEYPELTVLWADSNAMDARLQQVQDIDLSQDGHQVLLLDRESYLMMAYTPEHAGGEILEDLKFLLKTKM